jgi:hypothetical protein
MSQRILVGCDFNGCKTRVEVKRDPHMNMPSEALRDWVCLNEPARMDRSIDICPEHAKLFVSEKP